jgi:hypothetical protein
MKHYYITYPTHHHFTPNKRLAILLHLLHNKHVWTTDKTPNYEHTINVGDWVGDSVINRTGIYRAVLENL